MQEDSIAVVDTLTQAYSDKWSAAEQVEQANAMVQFMYSNDLIFVVLGVTLIIWIVLLIFLFRVDKKVSEIEKKANLTQEK